MGGRSSRRRFSGIPAETGVISFAREAGGDKRQDTFYAYPQEVDDWNWKRRQFTGASGPEEAEPMPLAKGYLRR